MPNYEYECKECDHIWEEQQTITGRNTPRYKPCPNCGTSENIVLKIGTPNFGMSVWGKTKPSSDVQQRLKDIGKNYKKLTGNEMERKFGHNYLG